MNRDEYILLIGGGFAHQTAPFAVHPNDEERANEYLDAARDAGLPTIFRWLLLPPGHGGNPCRSWSRKRSEKSSMAKTPVAAALNLMMTRARRSAINGGKARITNVSNGNQSGVVLARNGRPKGDTCATNRDTRILHLLLNGELTTWKPDTTQGDDAKKVIYRRPYGAILSRRNLSSCSVWKIPGTFQGAREEIGGSDGKRNPVLTSRFVSQFPRNRWRCFGKLASSEADG